MKFIISKHEYQRLCQLSSGTHDSHMVSVNMFGSMDKLRSTLGGVDESMAVEINIETYSDFEDRIYSSRDMDE